MIPEKHEILQQLRSLLTYYRVSGVKSYPLSTEIQDFLRVEYQDDVADEKPASTEKAQDTEGNQFREAHVTNSGTIEEIAEEVSKCRSCDLCQSRIASVPGIGTGEIRLMIVGGWLTVSQGDKDSIGVFGNQEDLMLSRMLEAIHLKKETTFVTNIIKCGIEPSVQPKVGNVEACVSYLHRQIRAIVPDVICTMGILATRALLRNSRPLSQLRGRFYDYSAEEKKISLIPTYHPAFLLKNPEMKMATWNDLQLIEKKLRE